MACALSLSPWCYCVITMRLALRREWRCEVLAAVTKSISRSAIPAAIKKATQQWPWWVTSQFYFRSKRSAVITLVQAATKSSTNFFSASLDAYTSAMARSSELEPKIKSTGVAVHFNSPL